MENEEKHGKLLVACNSLSVISRNGHSSGASDVPLVTGKYTYTRKKRLSRRKLGSFTEWARSGDIGSQKQFHEISRKQVISGDRNKIAEVKAVVEPAKIRSDNCGIESCSDANKRDKLVENLTSFQTAKQRASGTASVFQGISFARVIIVFQF